MSTAKKILFSGALLAVIGVTVFALIRRNRPRYEDLAAETKPIIVTS